MRTTAVEVVGGHVLSTGKALRGPMRVEKVTGGIVLLHAPPGRKILGISCTIGQSGSTWLIYADQNTGTTIRVVTTTTGGVGSDAAFEYIVILTA